MSPLVELVTKILSLFTIVGDATALLILISLAIRKSFTLADTAINFFGKRAILLSFGVVLISVISSLFYSEIAHFAPCSLCWWQRIFLYPQVFLLGIALWKKDKNIGVYSLTLSVIGAAIALYNTYLQFGGSPLIPCAANSVSCAQRYFLEFGYITLPTMSLTAFVLVIVFLLTEMAANKVSV